MESWASPALYRELQDTLKEVRRLDSVKLFLVPEAGYLVLDDDLVALRASLNLSVRYWKDDVITDTEMADSTVFAALNEAEMMSAVQAVFSTLRRRLDLFEQGPDGRFVRTRSGSPGNCYAFAELVPALLASNMSVFAFIYIDSCGGATGRSGDSRARAALAGTTNVYIAYTDSQSAIGACILADNPQLSNLSALLCQQSIKEAAIVEHSALESVLNEQGVVYSSGTEAFRKNLDCDCEQTGARIRQLIFLDSLDHYTRLCAQSRSADLLTTVAISRSKHVPASGTQLLFAVIASLLDHTSPEIWSVHAGDSVLFSPGRFAFEVPVFSSTMLYTTADMLSLKIVDHQSNTRKSLYTIVNRTVTQSGAMQLLKWLRAPLVDLEAISYRHDIVQHLLTEHLGRALYASAQRALKSCPPFSRTAFSLRTYAETRPSSIFAKLLDVYTFMQNSYPLFLEIFSDEENACSEALRASVGSLRQRLQDTQAEMLDFLQLIENTFDLDSPYLATDSDSLFADPNEIYFRPGYDDHMDTLQEDLQTNNALIREIYHDLSRRIKGCRLTFVPSQGYVIRAPKSSYTSISSESSAIVLENKASYIKFSTAELKNYSAQRMEAYSAYFSSQRKMEPCVVQQFSKFSQALDRVGTLLAEIDCLSSHAFVSAGTLGGADNTEVWPWVRPVMSTDGTLQLTDCRNPILMSTISTQSTVSNTIDFSPRVLLLTGPNAGGKTTLLRSIGHSVILAQIGCFVPCAAATIPIRRRLSVRLGTGDCLSKGYSTFMYEMINMSHILSSLEEGSLVMIDELGRGTSTAEGYGISRGIIETLIAHPNCFALVSTHILELPVSLAHSEAVKSVHMASRMVGNQLRLLYRVEDGTVESTYGLDVAESAGIPQDILSSAKDILSLMPRHNFQRHGMDHDCMNVLIALTGSLIGYQKGAVTKEQLAEARNRALEAQAKK